jgi:hypothetical protein
MNNYVDMGRRLYDMVQYKWKCMVKGTKVKFIPGLKHHAMKAYWGSGGIAPLIL